MGELVSKQREARQEATTRRIEDKNKTVDQYFAQNTTILMRLCQVDSSTDLPQVYQDIAKGGKRQERTLLQRAFDQTALDMGYTSMVFPVPPELATKIVSLAWRGDNDDLSVGLNPFTCAYRPNAEVQALERLISLYELVNTSGAAPSLADARALNTTDQKIALPATWMQLGTSLKLFHVLTMVLFTGEHDAVLRFGAFMQEYRAQEHVLESLRPSRTGYQLLGPALLLRWVQLRWTCWLDEQWNTSAKVPFPDLGEVFRRIKVQEEWEPRLPAKHLMDIPPALQGTPPPPVPPYAPPAPGVPPARPPAQPRPAGRAGALPAEPYSGVSVSNPVFESAFAPYRAMGLKVKAVIDRAVAAGVPAPGVPLNAAGTPMCVTWHVKGFCNSGCHRSADHAAHEPADREALIQWCAAHYHPA